MRLDPTHVRYQFADDLLWLGLVQLTIPPVASVWPGCACTASWRVRRFVPR